MSEIERQGDQIVIRPGKDIVAPMSKEFKIEIQVLMEDAPQELVVDLTGVEMIDSLGLGVLVAAHNSLNNSEGKLTLINACANILSLLKTMRLDKHLEVQATP